MTAKHLQENSYLPSPARIEAVIEENSQIKTFVLAFAGKRENERFRYQPGQFAMVSVPHCGEAPISFSSSPTRPGAIHLSVRRAGTLTAALHRLEPGAVVGLRGPYGRPFPMEKLSGRDLLFVAGGIGLAPLRSVINMCLDRRGDYGRIVILYGSRTPSDIAFRADIDAWQQSPGCECHLTVDVCDECWEGPVGVVTQLLDRVELAPAQTTALVCGPPLMIRAVLGELAQRGYDDEAILTTMERHMKCGLGVCGHCHLDGKYICVEGPVFNRAQLLDMDVMELKL